MIFGRPDLVGERWGYAEQPGDFNELARTIAQYGLDEPILFIFEARRRRVGLRWRAMRPLRAHSCHQARARQIDVSQAQHHE